MKKYSRRKKVLMLVTGNLDYDNRVLRSMDALVGIGYELLLLCESSSRRNDSVVCVNKRTLRSDGVIKRIYSLVWLVRYTVRGMYIASRKDITHIHCHDYDTLFIGIVSKCLYGKILIYDNHECVQDLRYLHRYPIVIRKVIRCVESYGINKSDAHVVVSSGIAELYRLTGHGRAIVIRNIPDIIPVRRRDADIKSWKSNRDLVYFGANLSRGRGLKTMAELLRHLPDDYSLIVYGNYSNKGVDAIKKELGSDANNSRVRFRSYKTIGELAQDSATFLFGLSIIEPIYYSYKYSLPNKLFEYAAMGVPVICSDLPEIGRLVKRYKIGIVIGGTIQETINELLLYEYDNQAFEKFNNDVCWNNEKAHYRRAYESTKSDKSCY